MTTWRAMAGNDNRGGSPADYELIVGSGPRRGRPADAAATPAPYCKNSRFGNSYGGSFESVPRALASSCSSEVYEYFVRTAARHGPIHYFNYSRPFVGRRHANGTGCCTFTWALIWTSRVRHKHAYFLLTPEPGRPQATPRSGPGTTGRQPTGPNSPTHSKQRARSTLHAACNGHDHDLGRSWGQRARSRGLQRGLFPIADRPDLRGRILPRTEPCPKGCSY